MNWCAVKNMSLDALECIAKAGVGVYVIAMFFPLIRLIGTYCCVYEDSINYGETIGTISLILFFGLTGGFLIYVMVLTIFVGIKEWYKVEDAKCKSDASKKYNRTMKNVTKKRVK